MQQASFTQRLGAEFLGTAFLLATVVGSGIMAERLAGGNIALALLCNTLPTDAILFVLITALGPISRAHFNPAVTGAFWLRGDIPASESGAYIAAQIAGGIAGVLAAHLMFDETIFQLSAKLRDGPAQGFAEWVDLRARRHDPPDTSGQCRCLARCRRPLHHRRLLVHGVHLLRQSRRYHCPRLFRHLRGYPPC
jgi:hypothetical protein